MNDQERDDAMLRVSRKTRDELAKLKKPKQSFGELLAELVERALPNSPTEGPPTPRGLGIGWPGNQDEVDETSGTVVSGQVSQPELGQQLQELGEELTVLGYRLQQPQPEEEPLEPPAEDSLEPQPQHSLEPQPQHSLEPQPQHSLEPQPQPAEEPLEQPAENSLEPPQESAEQRVEVVHGEPLEPQAEQELTDLEGFGPGPNPRATTRRGTRRTGQ